MINLTKITLYASAALALMMGPLSTYASLIDASDGTFGANSLLRDTDTGLEWLDLNHTSGKSYNTVTSELGTIYSGFRYATRAEVITLFQNAGIPDIDVGHAGTAANYTPIAKLMTLWTADIWTLGGGTTPDNFGYFLTENKGSGLLWLTGSTGEATSGPNRHGGVSGSGNYSTYYLASALVRDAQTVPEPATPMLICLGLGLAGFARRTFATGATVSSHPKYG